MTIFGSQYFKKRVAFDDRDQPGITIKELTARQKKKRKEALSDLKIRINARLDEKQKRRIACAAPPRYDDVFFDGIEWLNSSSEEPLDSGEYTADISGLFLYVSDLDF